MKTNVSLWNCSDLHQIHNIILSYFSVASSRVSVANRYICYTIPVMIHAILYLILLSLFEGFFMLIAAINKAYSSYYGCIYEYSIIKYKDLSNILLLTLNF